MKKESFDIIHIRPSAAMYGCLFILALVFSASGCSGRKGYVIGVSQCSEDIWRDKLNEELRMGTYLFNNVELRITSANDDDRRQIAQIDSLGVSRNLVGINL